jgi:hypothetical protein
MSFCLFFVDCIFKRHESGMNYLGKGREEAGRKCSSTELVITLYTCG